MGRSQLATLGAMFLSTGALLGITACGPPAEDESAGSPAAPSAVTELLAALPGPDDSFRFTSTGLCGRTTGAIDGCTPCSTRADEVTRTTPVHG